MQPTTIGMMQASTPSSTPAPPAPSQGAAGGASVRTVPQGTSPATPGCLGGYYEGTYNCVVDFVGLGQLDNQGQTAFTLEINKMTVDKGLCQEFCPDLVIAQGTGTLFGLAGPYAFQSQLDGGLDCQTGEFRANIKQGVYGFPGPSDPNDEDSKLAVVFEMGTFGGMLKGMHDSGPPEQIDGDWALSETVTSVSCTGPFSVKLQP